jgi:hypothetical protein
MTDAVPAPVALAYLATLSADLRTAVVLGPDGAVVAGDATIAAATLALVRDAGPAVARQAPHGDGRLFAARSAVHAMGLVVGPHALEAVVVHDLLGTLDDLRDC